MIPLQDQQAVQRLFAETLKGRVKIDFFTQRPLPVLLPGREECQFCEDVQTLLEEITRLNALLTLTVHELGADRAIERRFGVERVPATVLNGVLNRPATFYGVPVAALFPALVECVALFSLNRANLPAAAAKRLKRLRDPLTLRVFVSPQSEFCAPMMTAAFAFAIESKLVKAQVIEVSEFPRLAERYAVKQVPYTVINDRAAFPGLVDVETFADELVKAATHATVSAQLPRSGGTTLLGADRPTENVRPSGLIIPGR